MSTHPVPRGAAALALILAGGLLAGCGDGDGAAQDPGSSAAESPDAGGTGAGSTEAGVTVTDLPQLEGAYATALQTYVDFEEGRRRVARTGEMNTQLSFSAVGAIGRRYRQAAQELAGAGETYGGEVVVEVLDVRTRDTVMTIDLCVDATGLEVPDGAPELLGRAGRVPERVTVANLEGPWRVTRAEPVAGSC